MKAIAALVAIAVAALSSEPGNAACITPKPQTLIGRDLAGCCDVVTGLPGGAASGLRWIAVSWWGPQGGNLYVVRCSGVKVAETGSLGYVERLRPAPRIGGIQTVEVAYVPATGTNIKLRSVALVQYRGGKPRILWEHATFNGAYPPASLGPSYEERTSWRFLAGHSRIEATTVRATSGKTRKKVRLPVERYCFRSASRSYVPCIR